MSDCSAPTSRRDHPAAGVPDLARHDDRSSFLVLIEQDAEGGHALEQPIVARPEQDLVRLRDEAVAVVAGAGAVPDSAVNAIAPLSFAGDARTAALDMATIDSRFHADVLAAAARRAVAGWTEAVDGDDDASWRSPCDRKSAG